MCQSSTEESNLSRGEVWDKIVLGMFPLSLYVLFQQAPKTQGKASKICLGAQVTGSHLHQGNPGESIKRMLLVTVAE